MKFHQNILYIEFAEAVDAGILQATIKLARHRKSPSWNFIDDPADRRKVLIQYETLHPRYKALITEKYGNPYEYAGANHLKNHITTHHDSLQMLIKYRLSDGSALSEDQITRFSRACDYLHFLTKATKSGVKRLGFASKTDFYEAIINLIRQENISLPQNYSRLRNSERQFIRLGAESVIDGRIGLKNAKKVNDTTALAYLKEMIAHPNQLGDFMIARQYNKWAAANGCATITEATVGNYRRRHEMELTASRLGTGVYRNAFDKVVHRKRPSAPLLLINSDDNVLDLYYIRAKQNKKGTNITDYYHRKVLYVVIDAFNNYPLGYAIGETVTKDLVFQAYLNAIHHIQELTGSYYIWHQINADRWGLKSEELAEFFNRQATFTPSAFSNARSKVIEPSFATVWHNTLKTYINYAGHNISAASKLNRENVELVKRDFPMEEEAPAQIADFFNRLRLEQNPKTGMSKQAEWLSAWAETNSDRKRTLSSEERLLWFGSRHTHTNKITNRGLEFTLQYRRFTYDVAEQDYLRCIGLEGTVSFDPLDLSQVLFQSANGKERILCTMNQPVPMALADFSEGDRAALNRQLQEKKRINQRQLTEQQHRKELLQRAGIDNESLLQAGVLDKSVKIAAEKQYSGKQIAEDQDFELEDIL